MEAITPSTPPAALELGEADVKKEFIEVANQTGGAVDMTGWSLRSDKGNQFFFFPNGYTLQTGETVRIYSGLKQTTVSDGLFWTEKKIWQDKKTDEATLFDPYGRAGSQQVAFTVLFSKPL